MNVRRCRILWFIRAVGVDISRPLQLCFFRIKHNLSVNYDTLTMYICRICVVNIHGANSQIFCTHFAADPFLALFHSLSTKNRDASGSTCGRMNILPTSACNSNSSPTLCCLYKKRALVNSLHGYKVHIKLEGDAIQTHEVAQQRLWHDGLWNTLSLGVQKEMFHYTGMDVECLQYYQFCVSYSFQNKLIWHFVYQWNGFNINTTAVTLRFAKCTPTAFQSRINKMYKEQ